MSVPMSLSLSEWLSSQRDGKLAVAWRDGQWVTLAQMRCDATKLYKLLIVKQAQSSIKRWALCFEDSYQFTVALLAVLHAGGTPVIMGYTQENLLRERQDLFDAVITDLPLTLDCLVVNEVHKVKNVSANFCIAELIQLPAIDLNAMIVLYTSGSTGEPKEVLKPVHCLDEEARWLAELWGDHLQNTAVLSTVSHQHQYGLTFRIILPMALGIPFVSAISEFQEQIIAMQKQMGDGTFHEGRFVLISSPAFLKRLDLKLSTVPACQFLLSAGGEFSWENACIAKNWLGVVPHEIYGSTETGVLAWRDLEQKDAAWRKFPGVELSFNENKERWVVKSALIASTQGVVLDDRLEVLAGGSSFQLHGRYDRVVKLEEKRISLTEVEKQLQAIEGIQEAVALPVWQGRRQVIAAVVVLSQELPQILNNTKKDKMHLTGKWRQQLRKTLEPIAVPRLWQIVDVIGVNAQGKRDYEQFRNFF